MAPKKYIMTDGVMKMNPDYKKWKEQQNVGTATSTAVAIMTNELQALPVVTNIHDHQQLNQVATAPFAATTETTMRDLPQRLVEQCNNTLTSESILDQLGRLFAKYEVPVGMMQKLFLLSEFEALEFMIDDSGSMNMLSDTKNPATGQTQTRWDEAATRFKEMLEILAHVPFTKIEVCFLNRPDRLVFMRHGRDPESFYKMAAGSVDEQFAVSPSGRTPFYERLQDSFSRHGASSSVARYFFGDGKPDGGALAQSNIRKFLMNRPNPSQTPMTFLSCNSDDSEIEWMKETEEVAPYCAECDDYKGEAREVLGDQGVAMPYSKGLYLICSLAAACSPDDLDAMDQSVPFTKAALDDLLGIQHNTESYKYYFDNFLRAKKGKRLPMNAQPIERIKLKQDWKPFYEEFLQAKTAKDIPEVRKFNSRLAANSSIRKASKGQSQEADCCTIL